jgi:zinc protease
MGRLAVYGIGFDEINQYVGKVEAVTAADIQKLAADRLGPDTANLILVGDSKQFLEALKKAFPTVDVIPEAELDLDSPKLRK